MGYLLGVIWVLSVLALLVALAALAGTVPLMRRREPDAADHPTDHGMPAEDISFITRDGLTLGGWWIPSPRAALGTIIFCPGQNGSIDSDIPQAQPLHDAAFNVLMFDWRAHGRSEGETVTMGALEQVDLVAALDYVQQQRGVQRAGVMGFSLGAGVSLLAAAHDKRIAALVVDGAYPRLDGLLAGWAQHRQGLPAPLARGLARLLVLAASLRANLQLHRANPIEAAPQITAPTLLIHGDLDDFVSGDEVTLLHGALGGTSELWRVPDANHREAFTLHTQEYSARTVAWFAQHLTEQTGDQANIVP